jgi:hypothetical protein
MKESAIIFIVLLFIVLIIVGPLLSIWALNVLFPVLAIPYSLKTWAAMLVIAGLFKGSGISYKKE